MRNRFQQGTLQKIRGAWVARYRQDGKRRAQILGQISQMTKSEAPAKLAALVAPVNAKRREVSEKTSFGDFVRDVYLPFYRRKWKRSTAMTNEDRLAHHLTSQFDPCPLGSFDRDKLQAFLDGKSQTLSFSRVDHMRWDLKQIFDMAVAEGNLQRSPATSLFTPRQCRRASVRVMTMEEVRLMFRVLEVRERLIAKLVILAGKVRASD